MGKATTVFELLRHCAQEWFPDFETNYPKFVLKNSNGSTLFDGRNFKKDELANVAVGDVCMRFSTIEIAFRG